MRAILNIQITNGDLKGHGQSSVTIPYEPGMDVRMSVGAALVQLLGITLDKAFAVVGENCQQ